MVKPRGSSCWLWTWWGPEQDSSNRIKSKINRALVSLSWLSMDKELQPIPRSMPGLMEQQMTLPNSELQQKSYLLVSTAKGTQDYSCHLRCFCTTVLPATVPDITWEFSSDVTSTALLSPLWFPIALTHDPARCSSPLTRFQSCLQIFRYSYSYHQKLLGVLNGCWESWYALQSAGQIFPNSLMSSNRALLSPWPLEAAVPTSLPLSCFQSSTILAENLVHVYNRYQTERLSFYHSICLSAGIPQGATGFPCALCTKVALVWGDFVLGCFQRLEDWGLFNTLFPFAKIAIAVAGTASRLPTELSRAHPLHHLQHLLISKELYSTGFRD